MSDVNAAAIEDVTRRVVDMILDGENPVLDALRLQWSSASLQNLRLTGAGFYVDIRLPSTSRLLPGLPSFSLGDVHGDAREPGLGVGFVLFVSDGALDLLEGYCYGDVWPDIISGLVLSHLDGIHDPDELVSRTGYSRPVT